MTTRIGVFSGSRYNLTDRNELEVVGYGSIGEKIGNAIVDAVNEPIKKYKNKILKLNLYLFWYHMIQITEVIEF